MEEGPEEFTVETYDGHKFTFPVVINEVSPYLTEVYNNQADNEDVIKFSKDTDVSGEVLGFLHKHLALHNFKPKGVHVDMIHPELEKNLEKIDFDYVKHL